MRELSLKEQKEILVQILKSIHDFCKDNNLTYFLDCGTLIGCIRHQGIIPWDDDIDVLMPRKDYEKFVREYSDDGFTLFHYSKQSEFFYQYAKVSKNNTEIDEESVPNIVGLGVNIDVFVMDGMPNNFLLRRVHQDLLLFLSKYRALMIRLRKKFPHVAVLFRWKWVVRLLNFLGKKYSPNKTKYCGNITATTIRHKEIPRDCFKSSVLSLFEGSEYSIPIGYHEYLSRMYGSYMKMPSEEKRVAQHHFTAYTIEEE